MKTRMTFGLLVGMLLAPILTGCQAVITPESETVVSASPPAQISPLDETTATVSFQAGSASVTPTATATPIVHVIQSGETLSGIAAQYGVTVQDLMAANGIDNPLLLQPGQELVIPSGDAPPETEPSLLLPTPTPIPFGVRGVGFYETPVGSLDCLGEVVNTTAYTLTRAQVRVTLFDEQGTPLVAGDAFAAADVLSPAARAPFRILFLSPPPGFASHQVTIVRGEFTPLVEGTMPLVVEGSEGAAADAQFEVSGSIRNPDAQQTVFRSIVVVTTYDEQGRVTGFRQQTTDLPDGLLPGASTPFNLALGYYGGAPADFAIIAFGRTQVAEEEG